MAPTHISALRDAGSLERHELPCRTPLASLAIERHQEIVMTVGAVNPRKPVGQDAALEIVAQGLST